MKSTMRTLGRSESLRVAQIVLVVSLFWIAVEDGDPSPLIIVAMGLSLFAMACIVIAHLLRRRAERRRAEAYPRRGA
ncbi:hypothetical protein NBM05_15015 [Rothia sp. AR01]|uniref:Uncharacterized protein n=1 Tax=Rothia santali TaxID=2949643 RepID=A0A9X2HDC1_9MICC|nr:hypothetical protein [Rothia santali]MCP3427281.1 hypothetical protein [Rothia santali]